MDSEGIRLFFQLIFSGLIVGCIYASVALGFVLIYKATDIINFAQGELMLVGAYICYALITEFKIPFLPAFLLTLVFSAVLGVLIELPRHDLQIHNRRCPSSRPSSMHAGPPRRGALRHTSNSAGL